MSKVTGSDNGSVFVSKVSQGLAETLGTNWKHRCAYCPQNSGQVEKINRTLRETLTKLTLKTGLTWLVLLPLVLFQAGNTSYHFNLSPLEILYETPTPLTLALDPPRVTFQADKDLMA